MTSRSLTHLARYARGPRASALAATRLASLAFAIAAWGTPAFAASLLAIDVDGMDRTVAAGDDFYRYANGHWLAMTDIPSDKSQVGAFDQLHDIVIQRNKGILEEAASKPSSKLGMLYASYMDEAAIDAKGIAPVRPVLDDIVRARDKRALAVVMARLQRKGVDGLVNLGIELDDARPDAYAVTLAQPELGLPSKAYYLGTDEQAAHTRGAYVAYLSQLLGLAGEADGAARAQAVLDFETTLSAAELDRQAAHDPTVNYNPESPAQLARQSPGIEWTPYLDALGVGAARRLVVRHPASIAAATRLWAQAPLEVLKDWLRIRALDHYAPYLSAPFVDAQFAFDGKVLAGVSTIRPRWQRGVSMVTRRMGDALGHAYVDQYFPPSAKAAGERLAASILAAYRTRIEQNTWMDAGTKAKALEKLASLKPMVGYPDTWRDYSGVVLSRGDLTGNVDRLEMLDYDHELAKLGKPADRSEWMLPPVTSGGWANPVARVIVFPAASLQPPLFDPQADPAVNYGAIGVIMGHEFTHQFDNNGRRYDASGRLSDGWTKQDAARFETQADRLVAQYDRYEPLPGLHANGRLTLNENIADLGGLVLSHDAYVQSLGGHPAPVIDGLSGEQRFFLSYAQMSRSKTRDPELRQELLSEEHSIDPLRVDNMRNVDAWYAAFDVRPGQKLYLPPADRVHIW